ncbi:cytochrome P450 [Nocardioides sp. cx-173]|uniref:cytochrome P450 n=1 Tax=Nocardioides sp. cx-173 TaxID=2898796 RepID=UPI001E2CCFBE|nr:cytochrome P450 [Nocardioides sp. cx-173]MCD4524279.1 cytochrome P450 [Nocardioides sp. cx-173]UGB41671.1 cytochrome P450 [Nocardioides sp. cx-173]
MTATEHPEAAADETARKQPVFQFDRHAPDYREHFGEITKEMQSKCPVAWSDTHGGHWVASGYQEVFDIARRADVLSNDHDVKGVRKGYKGITIPAASTQQGGFLEMDPPYQRYYRQALNPYLSPAAVARWTPFVDEIVRAAINEKIESGSIDFVDDLANIVPAVLTLAMLGIPVQDWEIYCDPTHALVYTPRTSERFQVALQQMAVMMGHLQQALTDSRTDPKPGLVSALAGLEWDDHQPDDQELLGVLSLLIGGGFDTTTALTAHALDWLSQNPADRARLSAERETLLDSATEEFLRYFTPAPGDGRTISEDCVLAGTEFKEGDRLWLSWAMANRDPKTFENPDTVDLARKGNKHTSFGLGIHRCIGSNMARMVFKSMLTAVLDRMPDYVCDPARAVHYESVGVIQGMQHLPATFTPGERIGAGLDETLAALQRACEEQQLAAPITERRARADV